jgi:RHS repeat-associated protein
VDDRLGEARIAGGTERSAVAASEQPPPSSPLPAVAKPKGGGAIRGIGEKFKVSPSTGTGTVTVPISAPPGRAGFGPQLNLSYDSGAGNGPFGLGWSLGLPSISRKTDAGLPRYEDGAETDVFVLSGAEERVPLLDEKGERLRRRRRWADVDYEVAGYRPRVEGLHARIERWTRVDKGTTHWRVIGADNSTTLYGLSEDSRVSDPASPRRAFTFLISRSFDAKGNVIVYDYVGEDERGVDLAQAHETTRSAAARETQRYLKRVRYGNAEPFVPTWPEAGREAPLPSEWHFEVVFDYGDHGAAAPLPRPDREWPPRPDPFSSHRAGFEVRTYRRCERVLSFHHFPDEAGVGADCLVRSTDLTYSDETSPTDPRSPVYTFLESAQQKGYRRKGGAYVERPLPPLEFEYGAAEIGAEMLDLDLESAANLPRGIDGGGYRAIDLDGEGIAGVLVESGGEWAYKRNLSPLESGRARLGPLEAPGPEPSPVGSRTPLQLLDLAGDGSLDAVSLRPEAPGFFERTEDRGWGPFQALAQVPRIDWSNPNLRFADVTGDGRADVLIAEDTGFRFHPSLGEAGFGEPELVPHPLEESDGPRLLFADGTSTHFLADMCGDGLVDLVRVCPEETCYWPNLGYGRFGAKVTMDGKPLPPSPSEGFDPKRVHLADIDGSGTADLLYAGADGVSASFNRSGNSWAEPRIVATFPSADELASLEVLDLFGAGTACLAWSSPLPGSTGTALRYLDLMAAGKPHLMVAARNNLGSETRLTYAPSTRFMLEDERDGRPWLTRLPFPVHVVQRVETYDRIAGSRFVNRYAYHHGHYDGEEREFRGFGMVERWDTDELGGGTAGGGENWDEALWSAPVLERTWFHTGAYAPGGEISRGYAEEYWVEPALRTPARAADREAMQLADTVLDPEIGADEAREACRALKGMVLRKEVYGLDSSERAEHPYSVNEQSFEVRRLQRRGPNRHAIFDAHPRETLSFDYERRPDDPRVRHQATLEVDGFGNPLRRISVGYPRRPRGGVVAPGLAPAFQAMLAHDQSRLHVAATEARPTEALDDPKRFPDAHRAPLPAETIVAELTGIAPAASRSGITNLFTWKELEDHWEHLWSGNHDVPYEVIDRGDVDGGGGAGGAARRIVEHTRVRYRRDDLTGLLAPGKLQPLALPGQTYRLALTPGLVTRLLGDRVSAAMLSEAGYVRMAGSEDWWLPGELAFYSGGDGDGPAQERAEAGAHFFRARRSVDGLGAVSKVSYDPYDLLAAATTDPVGNVDRAVNDYRALAPSLVVDANGNRSATAFDALGMPCLTAVMGKPGEAVGDSLDDLEPDLAEDVVLAHLADPLADPGSILGEASERVLCDVFAYFRTRADPQPQPPVSYALSRETHAAEDPAGTTRHEHAFTYSDGFGREIQRKVQVDPGPVPGEAGVPPQRWVGSGWKVLDNKGNPVRSYEPFFSADHRFETARQTGVSSTLLYDPLGRVVATLHPDDSWEKAVFDNWRQENWDVNDTVLGRDAKGAIVAGDPRLDPDVGERFERLLGTAPTAFSSWHQQRIGGNFGATPEQRLAERDAAEKAAAHFETPSVAHLDAAGRTCLRVVDDGRGNRLPSRVALDAEDKPLAVFDALGRRVFEYMAREPGAGGVGYVAGYAVAGFGIYQNGMDGGERRTLADIAGRPVHVWDGNGRAFRVRYDAAGRPTHRYVKEAGGAEVLHERLLYGEGMPERNLCGRSFRQYDEAGLSSNERYDFKGHLLEASRQLTADHHPGVDWSGLELLDDPDDLDTAAAPLLSAADRFVSTTLYDAQGRVVQTVTPHSATMRPNVFRPSYGVGGLPDGIDVWLRRASAPAGPLDPATADLHPVLATEHDARGQRTRVLLGNGTETRLEYDDLTFQLARLLTTRDGFAADQRVVQDLSYAYDPAGNVTRILDRADIQNVVFFRNRRVDPTLDFSYDALYRLIEGRGREHLGLNGGVPSPTGDDDSARIGLPHPGDGNAMGTYKETYAYDLAGNLEEVVHQVSAGTWRRPFAYAEPSLIDPAETCNRLSATGVAADPAGGPLSARYEYDAHGNTVRMPHLPALRWSPHDHLRSTTRQAVKSGTPETTHYGYDGGGVRLRKATDRQAPAGAAPRRRTERVYLGPVELFREYGGDGTTVTLARETLHVGLAGLEVAVVETRTAGTDPGPAQLTRYRYRNHFGSTTLELDGQAAIVSYEEYSPYGSTTYQAVRSQIETPKRDRWSGKERDEESGFYYHGARYYAPWLGRWTSPDPIGLGDGADLYAYSHCNPIRMNDPGGTQGRECALNNLVDDLNDGELKFDPLDRTKNDPSIKSGPIAEGGEPMTKREAGNHHKKQTRDYRQEHGMSGSDTQAGHTAAKRHVGESGISAADWDKQPMQQLPSRKGQGLDVDVTDQRGKKTTTTRHRSQEGLIDEGVDRLKKPGSPTGGKLTPQGQLDNAAYVEWRTQGTGMDQREIDIKRKGGLAPPEKGPPVGPDGRVIVKDEAKAVKAEVKAVGAEAKAVKAEVKALKAEVAVIKDVGKAARVGTKLAKAGRHFTAAVPGFGIAAGQASAVYSASQGDATGAALDEAGFIPVAGDLLDAARGGVALGEAADETFNISGVAAEHGALVDRALGSGDGAHFLGAAAAATSAITIAPAIAVGRTIVDWLK